MQIIYSGIKHLSEALKNSKKVLLVCDSSFPFLNIKEDIEGIALPYTIFDDFTPNNPSPFFNFIFTLISVSNTDIFSVFIKLV